MEEKRDLASELAKSHYEAGDPLGWFDDLYQQAAGDTSVIPWADRGPNPHLTAWCERESFPRPGSRVLVVGCGLGDDAEYLASRGASVTAFDLSPTAVAWCRARFPGSTVQYQTANLLEFTGDFDLVVEIYTIQAMPLELRKRAIAAVGRFGRELLVICRGRDEGELQGLPPIPLTKSDLEALAAQGLSLVRWEDFDDPYKPGTRRFRVHWRR